MKPVGILGGMGPEATVLLMQKVLNAVQACDDADHIPLIVHQNSQVPSRIKALIEGTGEDPGPTLAQMARELEAAGACALAMPCNTAHHYVHAVQTASALPFLDMIDLTVQQLTAQGARHVGMLASPATRRTGIFEARFAAHDLRPVWLQPEEGLLAIIRSVKAGDVGQSEVLRKEANTLVEQGADCLLVACTELSLLAHALPDDVPVLDSLDCLVREIVAVGSGVDPTR